MYASVHDQPPSALLPHSHTPTIAVPAAPGPAPKQPLPSTLLIHSPLQRLLPHFSSSSPRSLSQHSHQLVKSSSQLSQTPPRRPSRLANHSVPMHRSPYSRETTDISDQELRQILESENISGLPAPYCLVPNYDGQVPLPQNTLWTPVIPQQHPAHSLNIAQQQQQQQAGASSSSSVSGSGAPAASGGNTSNNTASSDTNAAASPSTASGEAGRRRTRTTLTPYQLRVLFRVWERTQYPSSDLRFRLATNLMMTPRNVQIWFQNQRQKTKERAEMRRRTHSPSNQSAMIPGASGPFIQQPLHHPLQHPHPHPHPHHDALASGIAMPGRSPPESPYRYAHGPPPMTPSIPAMHLQHAPSSVPAQYMIHNREPPLLGRAVSQTTSPVSGGYAMLTPPAPYQPPASQQPHHLANRRPWTAHSYQSTQQQQQSQQPSPHSRALLPPSALPPAARHLEHSQHHRHTSQPQPLQGLNRHSVHLPLLPPSSHEQHQHQQHLFHPGSQPQPHDTHHLIPSPTTPTSKEQGTEAEQAHAPIVSPKKPQSPSLSLSLSSLSAASLRISGNSSSQTVREHPEHRRSRLADILNPIRRVVGHPISRDENAGARPESDSIKPLPPQVSSAQASGPLPSLGSILASVHTSTSCSDSGSIITTPKPEPSPPTSSQDSSEKWRPW